MLPTDALAWGAGVHLSLGLRLLKSTEILPAVLQTLLTSHPYDFLYGCIAADITLGKKYTHHLEHCHNWSIGIRILERANTIGSAAKACAYGYLSHLAADTVAHNYFVPYRLAMTYNSILLNHAYWEIRADSGVSKTTWNAARKIAQRDNHQHDTMLSESLSDTIFSFNTNKQLFNSMMLISRLRRWHKIIFSMSKHSKWEFDKAEHHEYMTLSYHAMVDTLSDPHSPYWRADPTGERALNAANLIRKNLNLLWLDGKLHQEDADIIIKELRQRFKLGITEPDEILPLFTVL